MLTVDIRRSRWDCHRHVACTTLESVANLNENSIVEHLSVETSRQERAARTFLSSRNPSYELRRVLACTNCLGNYYIYSVRLAPTYVRVSFPPEQRKIFTYFLSINYQSIPSKLFLIAFKNIQIRKDWRGFIR